MCYLWFLEHAGNNVITSIVHHADECYCPQGFPTLSVYPPLPFSLFNDSNVFYAKSTKEMIGTFMRLAFYSLSA